ncbi:hypothetical protein HOY82DRAFT_599440 [Tuber indicum]|nr:hypothetical protein HOY82DRAFT_599440 [Tuber indicum]
MLPITRSPIGIVLSRFEKRDCQGDKGVGGNDGESPVAIVGLFVASLTLIVGIVSLRSSRFRRCVSYILPLHFIRVYRLLLAFFRHILHVYSESYNPPQNALGIALPNPLLTPITITEDLPAFPATGIPIPSPVFIYNNFSNACPACPHSDTFPCGHSGIAGGDDRDPQVGELLSLGRLEPVATW